MCSVKRAVKNIKEFTLKIIYYRQEEPSATAMDISTGHMVTHSVKEMQLMTMLIMVTLKVLSYKDTWSTIIIVVIITINIMMMNITKVLSYMEDHLKNKQRLEQEWVGLCAYEAEPNSTAIAFKVVFIVNSDDGDGDDDDEADNDGDGGDGGDGGCLR